jgi:tetratricopeptide (TPR) repeat protein
MTGQLVRQILLGASTAGLQIAGTAALGPAWPILSGALAPVLDRLREKLGGADPVGSPEDAERAAEAFEQDQRLQELLRSNLAEALKPVLAGQQHVESGLQRLCQLVLDNSQALEHIQQSVGSIDAKLDAGVTLSDETIARIVEATAQRTAVTLAVRDIANEEAEAAGAAQAFPETWVTRDELIADVNRAEVKAVGQIDAGKVAEATETLRRARSTLAPALAETPSDIRLRLLQGYLLKAMAQARAAAEDYDAADRCLTRAETIFRLVMRDIPADPEMHAELASGINGLANVVAKRGSHPDAVSLYWKAVQLAPTYGYAWHDLFLSLVALADQGDLRPDDLDKAWQRLLATAPGYPELDPAHLRALRVDYERLRPPAGQTRNG